MKPVLQVALDIPDLFKALRLATRISNNLGCNGLWLEAGTPLLKNWGSISVKALKETTKCVVVADTKTMDTGALEAELMLKAGADVVTVLGLADDSTINDALEKAHSHGKTVMADLINHPDPVKRAVELDSIGVDIILYHVGIDVQVKRKITATDMLNEIKALRERIRAKLAVAGGIKHGGAKPLVSAGADIVIVGGAITKAVDPVESTKKFLEEINS